MSGFKFINYFEELSFCKVVPLELFWLRGTERVFVFLSYFRPLSNRTNIIDVKVSTLSKSINITHTLSSCCVSTAFISLLRRWTCSLCTASFYIKLLFIPLQNGNTCCLYFCWMVADIVSHSDNYIKCPVFYNKGHVQCHLLGVRMGCRSVAWQ